MGTMIDLRVGNLVVDWGKNAFFRDHRSLFQEHDVRNVSAGEDSGEKKEVIRTLARHLGDVVPRLRLLGYTLGGAREEYDSLLQAHGDSRFTTFDAFQTGHAEGFHQGAEIRGWPKRGIGRDGGSAMG